MKYSTTRILSVYTISALFVIAFSVVSCSNPAGNEDDHEEHHAPQGAVLKMNGQEIVRYEDGEVTGEFAVNEGEETPLVTIFYLADDGDEFQPEDHEFELRWSVEDESVAIVEHHAEDGAWSFHIHGVAQGDTEIVFQLFHSEEGHSDFDTPAIPITVH